jgi:hypothetical protein
MAIITPARHPTHSLIADWSPRKARRAGRRVLTLLAEGSPRARPQVTIPINEEVMP